MGISLDQATRLPTTLADLNFQVGKDVLTVDSIKEEFTFFMSDKNLRRKFLKFAENQIGQNDRAVLTAEDAVNEAYARALKAALNSFKNGKPIQYREFKNYIYEAIRNIILDHLIKSNKTTISSQDVADWSRLSHPGKQPEEEIIEKEEITLVIRLIKRLTQEQQEIISLRLEGKSYEQIAQELQISAEAAKQCFHRAMVTLKEKIEEDRHRPSKPNRAWRERG